MQSPKNNLSSIISALNEGLIGLNLHSNTFGRFIIIFLEGLYAEMN